LSATMHQLWNTLLWSNTPSILPKICFWQFEIAKRQSIYKSARSVGDALNADG